MFSRHPLEVTRDKLTGRDLADALRLAIMAELDAINLYLQIAGRVDDDEVKKVFEDVAREEKTHVGEFLALLKRLDPEQVEELKKGAEEVAELTGVNTEADPADPPGNGVNGFEETVKTLFRRVADSTRVLRRHLPVTIVGPGIDYVPAPSIAYSETGVGVEAEAVTPLREIAVEFSIPQRLVDRFKRFREPLNPVVEYAAKRLVAEEEKLVISQLLSAKETLRTRIGSWERPGEAVDDVAKAVSMLEAEGLRGPYVLLVSPQRYARLLVVHERAGVMELSRLEKLAKVVKTPFIGEEQALLVSAEKAGLDIVVGVDTVVDYIGLEQGAHRFRAWETIALRVFNPHSIIVMQQE